MDQTFLAAPPGDGISSVCFSPTQTELLLVTSWDGTMRLYDAIRNTPRSTFNFNGACLTGCFNYEGSGAFVGGLDARVRMLDFSRGSITDLGCHSKAVSCMECTKSGILFTGSWDGSVIAWDPRGGARGQIETLIAHNKVFSISTVDNRLVIATSGRQMLVYDIRNLSQPEQVRESPLKHQTRKIACNPDGMSFTVGSIEGRVAIEYFNMDPEIQSKKYAFKCHRKGDRAYPVNAIAFHPIYGTFATGGCDGIVSIWDAANRKRVSQLQPYPTSIASMAFSNDGTILAVASSYTFEEGDLKDRPDDNVYLKRVDEVEVRPKSKA